MRRLPRVQAVPAGRCPGLAGWNVRTDLVGRAMRLIADGVVDREGVAGSRAARLQRPAGAAPAHAELGAGPVALARAQRAHTPGFLLETTALAVTDIAFAAGFTSVRQFNDTMREVSRPPRELRRARGNKEEGVLGGISLRLPYREPLTRRACCSFSGLKP